MDNYYQQLLYIPEINKDDKIIGPVERWQAHKKAVLHHGFTVILKYQDKYLLQHRKHPVFDNCLDLSFSSHPVYIENKLQDDVTAINHSLRREWQLQENNLLGNIDEIGRFYYKAFDQKSGYWEHEIDYIYLATTSVLPKPNLEFSYGFFLVDLPFLRIKPATYKSISFAPWVNKITENNLLK